MKYEVIIYTYLRGKKPKISPSQPHLLLTLQRQFLLKKTIGRYTVDHILKTTYLGLIPTNFIISTGSPLLFQKNKGSGMAPREKGGVYAYTPHTYFLYVGCTVQ